jgi:hypothetical protein
MTIMLSKCGRHKEAHGGDVNLQEGILKLCPILDLRPKRAVFGERGLDLVLERGR